MIGGGKIQLPPFRKTGKYFVATSPFFGATSPFFRATSPLFRATSPFFRATSPIFGASWRYICRWLDCGSPVPFLRSYLVSDSWTRSGRVRGCSSLMPTPSNRGTTKQDYYFGFGQWRSSHCEFFKSISSSNVVRAMQKTEAGLEYPYFLV
jgi:hypothetical protein